MNPGVLVYALRALEQATKDVIDSQNIDKAGETIKGCAIIAAVAGVGSGWLPGAGAFVATAAWVAAIWGMYVKINKDLGISIKDNILKSLASAILTNILASAGSLILMLSASFLLSFIPGLGSAGAIVIDGFIGYITVFASGVLYIKVLTKPSSACFLILSSHSMPCFAKTKDLSPNRANFYPPNFVSSH